MTAAIPPACCAGADHGKSHPRLHRVAALLLVARARDAIRLAVRHGAVAIARVRHRRQMRRTPTTPTPTPSPRHHRRALAVTVADAQSDSDTDAHIRAPRHQRADRRPAPIPARGSINDLAKQRFNQMITNRVLGTVLLGINEQVNCNDCVSAFGSAGSFSAGIHGRKNLTANLSLLAGIAYTQYSEGGYSVTSAPIGAFALRYDFVDWGSSRPFFDIGAILTPYEKVRYRAQLHDQPRRGIAGQSDHRQQLRASMAAPAGSAGCRRATKSRPPSRSGSCGSGSRATPTRPRAFNPFDAIDRRRHRQAPTSSRSADSGRICSARASKPTSTAAGCNPSDAIRHRRHRDRQRHRGADDRQPGLVRIWRPPRLPHHQGLGRRPLPQRHRRPAAGRQHPPWRRRVAGELLAICIGHTTGSRRRAAGTPRLLTHEALQTLILLGATPECR